MSDAAGMLATLEPTYLVHGEDHGAVAERRARLRALAESAGGAGSVELLEGDAASPAGVAAALATMTLALQGQGAGRRVILVDGVERWREADVKKQLAPVMGTMPPDTTLALFAREDARAKAPEALHRAVVSAGGRVLAHPAVKPWELSGWVRRRAGGMGLTLDADAARTLIELVGQRQQRLLRELEKLALATAPEGSGTDEPGGPPRIVSAEEVLRLAARSAERQAFALADALVARDAPAATMLYLRLREQGERLPGLTSLMARRLRDALGVALRLRAGESAGEVRRALRMPARAAERFLADIARTDPERLRRAMRELAELELDSRGGAPAGHGRSALGELQEDTLALRAIAAMAA